MFTGISNITITKFDHSWKIIIKKYDIISTNSSRPTAFLFTNNLTNSKIIENENWFAEIRQNFTKYLLLDGCQNG